MSVVAQSKKYILLAGCSRLFSLIMGSCKISLDPSLNCTELHAYETAGKSILYLIKCIKIDSVITEILKHNDNTCQSVSRVGYTRILTFSSLRIFVFLLGARRSGITSWQSSPQASFVRRNCATNSLCGSAKGLLRSLIARLLTFNSFLRRSSSAKFHKIAPAIVVRAEIVD